MQEGLRVAWITDIRCEDQDEPLEIITPGSQIGMQQKYWANPSSPPIGPIIYPHRESITNSPPDEWSDRYPIISSCILNISDNYVPYKTAPQLCHNTRTHIIHIINTHINRRSTNLLNLNLTTLSSLRNVGGSQTYQTLMLSSRCVDTQKEHG